MVLSKRQNKKVHEMAKKHGLKFVLLFGSHSNGKTHRESDIDIAYLPKKDLGFEGDVQVNYELTNILQTDKIDTVDLRKAPSLLMKQIFQDHKILFCSDYTAYHLYQIYSFKRFVEASQLFKLRDVLIDKYFTKYNV